jgi:hypothetical protein
MTAAPITWGAKRHHDLRREYESNARTHNQCNTDDDVVCFSTESGPRSICKDRSSSDLPADSRASVSYFAVMVGTSLSRQWVIKRSQSVWRSGHRNEISSPWAHEVPNVACQATGIRSKSSY